MNIAVHEINEKKYLVEMRGLHHELIELFNRLIARGAVMYHPKDPVDRYPSYIANCPQRALEQVDLKDRIALLNNLHRNFRDDELVMVYLSRSIEDAIWIKML